MLHRVQAKRIDERRRRAAVPRRRLLLSADDRRAAARAEPLGIELVVGRPARRREFGDRVFGALVQTPDEAGRVHDLRGFIARAKAAGVLVAVGDRSAQPRAADAARRDGRRRRLRQLAALRRAARLRRSARGVLRDAARSTCGRRRAASSACRSTRTATPRTAWRCRRASSTSAARRRRRTSARRRRCSPTSPAFYAVYHGPKGLTAHRARACTRYARAARARARRRSAFRQLNDALLRHAALRGAGGARRVARSQAARRAASTSATARDGTINIALDETTDADDVAGDRRGVRGRRDGDDRAGASTDRRRAGSTSSYPGGARADHRRS